MGSDSGKPRDDAPRSRRRRLLVGLAVSAVTTVLLLVLLEILAQFLVPAEVFSFKPIYACDEIAGYRFASGVAEYAFGARVETNRYGRRGPEWAACKPPGTFRIALVGDSLAFGFGVEFDRTFGEVLARAIRDRTGVPCEVLNLAAPGYNATQELSVLQHLGLTLEPDLVLVLTCSNDAEPPLWVDDRGYLCFGAPDAGAARVESEAVPLQDRWGPLRHSALAIWTKMLWTRYKAGAAPEPAGGWMQPDPAEPLSDELRQRVLDPLVAMSGLCRERRVPMVLLTFAGGPFRRIVREFSERTQDPVLELFTLFPEVDSWPQMVERFGLGWDSHPSPEAHARWARGTLELLERSGLLPRK